MNIAYHIKTLLLWDIYSQTSRRTVFDEFVTSLRKLSADFEFGVLNSSLIMDIIVAEITSNRLRERKP